MKCPTKLLNNFHHTLSMFSHYLDKFNSSLCCETVRSAILAIACLLVTCSFPAITICSLSVPCPALYFHWIRAVLGLAVSRKSETRDGRRDEQTDGQYWLNMSVCLSVCLSAVLVGMRWYFNTTFCCVKCPSDPCGWRIQALWRHLWRHNVRHLENFKWRYLWNGSSDRLLVWL